MKNRHSESTLSAAHGKNEKPSVSRGKRIIATLAGAAAIGGLGASVEACAPNPNKGISIDINIGDSSDPSDKKSIEGIDETLTLLDIENENTSSYPYYRQLDAVLPFLEEHRQESLDAISSYLDDPNSLTGDQKQAQIDLNIISANIYTTSQQSNRILARNLVAGSFKDNAGFAKQIASGETRIIERMAIDQVSKPFNSGTIVANTLRIEIKPGTNTRLMNVIDENNLQVYNHYIQDVTDKDGKHVTPVIIATAIALAPGYVTAEDVADWQPEF